MKRKKRFWMDALQIVLMLAIIGTAVLLVLDWKRWDYCFCVVFGLASALFFLLAVGTLTADRRKSRFGIAALYLIAMTLMLGLFTGSMLTIWMI